MNKIPEFPEQVELEIAHLETLTEAIEAQGIKAAEFSIYYLTSWYYSRPAMISRIGDRLVLDVEGSQGGHIFLGPFGKGPIKHALDILLKHIGEDFQEEKVLRYVPTTLADEIRKLGKHTKEESHRDYFDYIYSREELTSLAGRKFQKRRNLVNKVQKIYDPKIHILTPDDEDSVLECMETWYELYGDPNDFFLQMEKKSVHRIIANLWELGGVGIKTEIDDGFCGITWAVPLTKETWLVPVEKARREIKGLYQYVNWALAQELPAEVKFLNREADLGLEGLRTAKTRYKPIGFEEKFSFWF